MRQPAQPYGHQRRLPELVAAERPSLHDGVVNRGDGGDLVGRYDRQFVLFGPKRNAVLDLEEVRRYGVDSADDPDFVSVYGMPPAEWYALGARMVGRTAVECTRDSLARAIAEDVASVASSGRFVSAPVVIDPFVGSGNTLYWIQRRVVGARGLGFELDPVVYRLTRRNLALLSAVVEIRHVDYEVGLSAVGSPGGGLVIVFVAPPWGDALDPDRGLDLRRTSPPVMDVLDTCVRHFPENPLLFAVQVPEQLDRSSLTEVSSRCEWTTLHQYDLSSRAPRHGVLLGTHGWTPTPQAS
jgi:hypothetical protein